MDIKLKNKYLQVGALVLALFLLSISLLAGINFWHNRDKVTIKSYFESSNFESQVSMEFENIKRFYTTYENYNIKTADEKINDNEVEITNIKENYDNQLQHNLDQVENNYKSEIAQADRDKNTDKVKRLIEERDKKLEEIKKTQTKTIDDVKKEILSRDNKDYEAVKKAVETNSNIKYYMWDSNDIIFTNLKDVKDIKEYVNSKALFSIYFPSELSSSSSLSNIKSFFQSKNYKGYILIPKESEGYSYFQGNYNYYNSLRLQTIAEFFIALIALVGGLWLLKYLKEHYKDSFLYIDKFKALCLKLPIDIRFIILVFYTLFIFNFRISVVSSLRFPSSSKITTYFFTVIYFLFVYACVPDMRALYSKETTLKEFWEQSLTFKLHNKLISGIKNKSLFFRIFIFLGIASLGSAAILLAIYIVTRSEEAALLFFCIYCLFIFIYIISKGRHLDKIIRATEEIAAGNLNYNLKDKGNSILSKMAGNINNLQDGVKKAVESQLKSDRLKSELITNVSHDLKTPLTSIINYVDLLKREDLSKEEMKDYIGVLDRKTQRLKVLIEDLFEASKMASGSVELNMEKVDTAQLLNQALAEFEEKIAASNLIFKVNIPHSKVYANLDGKKTWRVFENLIGNILKYSQANTRVYINLYESENKMTITMKNISAYELDFDVEEIYERFKRGDASRHTEGSGLGLAIAKSIVELQGGSLNVEIDGDLFKATIEFNKY